MLHQQKKQELEEVFKKMNIDDVSDVNKYLDLHSNVSKARDDM